MQRKKVVKKELSWKKSDNLVKFLWEARVLKYMPNAGLNYLKGPAGENVAEHVFYTTIIGWVLAKLEGVDENKIIKMCLIHDLAEARGGERNLINKFYSQPLNEPRIVEEISKDRDLQEFFLDDIFQEFFQEKTLEAKIAKDSDILAGILLHKECLDLGNKNALKWLNTAQKRLKTKKAKELGSTLVKSKADDWWLEIAKKHILKTKFF